MSNYKLILSGRLVSEAPQAIDFEKVLNALEQNPEHYFILEFDGGFLQGVFEPQQGYQCEFKQEKGEDDSHYASVGVLHADDVRGLCLKMLTGDAEWFKGCEWEVLDQNFDENDILGLGQYAPADARKVFDRLVEDNFWVEMKQDEMGRFVIWIKAGELDQANLCVNEVFNLQV